MTTLPQIEEHRQGDNKYSFVRFTVGDYMMTGGKGTLPFGSPYCASMDDEGYEVAVKHLPSDNRLYIFGEEPVGDVGYIIITQMVEILAHIQQNATKESVLMTMDIRGILYNCRCRDC